MEEINPARRGETLWRVLLGWYHHHGRILPWRQWQKDSDKAYKIWVSEVMLQQTTVPVVIPYYRQFLRQFPTLASLASASRDRVLVAWQGLGYYRRAHHMHEAARMVMREHGGRFPRNERALMSLPGIGAYTASALCVFAFGMRSMPLDGNIIRVMARLYCFGEPLPLSAQGCNRLRAHADACMPPVGTRDAGAHAYGEMVHALMDFASTVCKAAAPLCDVCVLRPFCRAYQGGCVSSYPVRVKKKRRPCRHAIFFWVQNRRGDYLVYKRAQRGLLAGLLECPSTPWQTGAWDDDSWRAHVPCDGAWSLCAESFIHVFTHFTLYGRLAYCRRMMREGELSMAVGAAPWRWIASGDEACYAFSTLMRKIKAHKERYGPAIDMFSP
ncbi:MAG: A/G-specific adenine glycosylase [Alphaproteobacteria bacterium GM7ARS4]|nr:A/G-specific adenine glycosylase [Alphaproteobacteria bacterium GM7ARS4]